MTIPILRTVLPGLAALTALGCASGPAPNLIQPEDRRLDPYQGKYLGRLAYDTRETDNAALVLIADGGSRYRVVLEFKLSGKAHRIPLTAAPHPSGSGVQVTGEHAGRRWTGRVLDRTVRIWTEAPHQDSFSGTLTEYSSPTLEVEPPPGAIVLLPYGTPGALTQAGYDNAFTNPRWQVQADGSVLVGKGDTRTRRTFGDCKIHLEFRIPYMPKSRGQARGNSGIYIQDRYEVQLLDSFGLLSKDNDCGGVYKIAKPRINACLPPMRWQTYDLVFKAARFGPDGKKVVKEPELTVFHNGVPIHRNLKLPRPTAGGAKGHIGRAPIRLQDHHNPMRFRNFWVQEIIVKP